VQPEANKNPEGEGAGRNSQAKVSTMEIAAVAGIAGRNTAEMTVADAVTIRHEAKIPQQSEV
jgi:hypothetical protein